MHVYINEQVYVTLAVDDKQLQMLLSNKVTGSVRGQYRHEVQSTEMNRDDIISRFWIRSSVDFKILHAKFHILGRKAQPVRIAFWCLEKNVPFDGPFHRTFSDAPRNVLTSVSALISSLHVYHKSIARLRAFHVAGRIRAGE